jgi:8-oxo-dGTP diphosphatase
MNNPRVGVAVIVKNDKNEFLLCYRKSKLGYHTWGLPGGKLDFAEELTACAIRELEEETSLIVKVSDLKLNGVTTAVFDEETHYITVIYETNVYSGEVTVVEPDKCEEWRWFTFDTLPEDLFLPFKNYVNAKSKI